MSLKDKLVYINAIKDRYINSNKEEKKIILDEFCKVCNYNRKYAIRILNKPTNKWQYKKNEDQNLNTMIKILLKLLKQFGKQLITFVQNVYIQQFHYGCLF